jgi:hypothetical protein
LPGAFTVVASFGGNTWFLDERWSSEPVSVKS